MNCHLAAGKTNSQRRFNEMKIIYNTTVNDNGKPLSKYDIQFLFGSLNFQLESTGKSTNLSMQKKELSKLLREDQLWSQYHQYNYLPKLIEAPIGFLPTYKFIKNSPCYDLSKSSPFWCDRILWGTNDAIKCTHYASVDSFLISDHKPVYGIYLISLNQSRKEQGLFRSLEEEKGDTVKFPKRKPHFAKSSSALEVYGNIRKKVEDNKPLENINTSYVVIEQDKPQQEVIALTLTENPPEN